MENQDSSTNKSSDSSGKDINVKDGSCLVPFEDSSSVKCEKKELKFEININDGDMKSDIDGEANESKFNSRDIMLIKTEQSSGEIKPNFSPEFITDNGKLLHETVDELETAKKESITSSTFRCKICFKSFAGKNSLSKHEKIHEPKRYSCPICSKLFTYKSKLKCHEKTHTFEKPFQCEVCSKSFTSISYLRLHKTIHTGEKSYHCKYCSKSFTHSHYLTTHERTHTGEKPYTCKYCRKAFSQKSSLNKHENIHNQAMLMKGENYHVPSEDPPPNIVEYETDKVKAGAEVHTSDVTTDIEAEDSNENDFNLEGGIFIKSERSIEEIEPNFTPDLITDIEKLLEEEENITSATQTSQDPSPKDSKEKPFRCQFCSKVFSHKDNWRNHERIHTGEKPYKCKYCLKSFSQKSSLNVHEKIHRGEKSHHCNHCSKSFVRKFQLDVHSKVHAGNKPTKISRESYENYLKKHDKPRTDKKSLQCEFCSKSFTSVGYLNQHRNVHTGEKSYNCKYCTKSFTHSNYLKSHERTHTGEKPYACKYCQRTFSQKSTQNKHEKTHKKFEKALLIKDEKYPITDVKREDSNENDVDLEGALFIKSERSPEELEPNFTPELITDVKTLLEEEENRAENITSATLTPKKSKEKPFRCQFCSKCFSHKDNWRKHERIHTGEKPYECKYCRKSFSQNSSLSVHEKIHRGEKSHHCDYCSKSFIRKSQLHVHMKVHVEN